MRMTKEKEIMEPWLPGDFLVIKKDTELLTLAVRDELQVREMKFTDAKGEEQDFSRVCVSKVVFEGCSFVNSSFEKGEFTDVVFKSCNFSNADFSDGYFNRCQMISSKGVGAKFSGSSIQNMVFSDCNLEYVNFDSSKLERVRFCETELSHGAISQCRCKDMSFQKVCLHGASFFKTSLKGMDFTSSDITELVLSDECTELKGAVVDLYQAAELAKHLGIIIK